MMIVDAGGGTVDISSYAFVSTSPLTVEEIASADCKWYFRCGISAHTTELSIRHHARFHESQCKGENIPARFVLAVVVAHLLTRDSPQRGSRTPLTATKRT